MDVLGQRVCSNDYLQDHEPNIPSRPPLVRRDPLRHLSPASSTNSFYNFSPVNSCISRNTSTTSWSLTSPKSSLPLPLKTPNKTTSTSSVVGAHTHWCTDCENPRAISTCDGWKRHMKEHDEMYCCSPLGSVEVVEGYLQCAFCHLPSPDQSHLDSHDASACAEKPRQYTRKVTLVRHLRTQHGVIESSALADQWRSKAEKRFLSCGFCVSLFTSINDQLNHIDNHFKQHCEIATWDFTKVIRGLLLQPAIDRSWTEVSATYDHFGFSWDQASNKDLQRRLEMSDESSGELAVAAFNCSVYEDTVDDSGLWLTPSSELPNFFD